MCKLELKQFEGIKKEELSLIEVAHAILKNKGDVMLFQDLATAVAGYVDLTPEQMKQELSQFYTDMNIDGSFISLGENRWGLRSWYPIDSIDEEVSHIPEEEEEAPRRKKRKKATPFVAAAGDEDVIDYNADDPEDEDIAADDEEEVFVDEEGVVEDKVEDLGEYKEDLSALTGDEEEEDLPDGIEGELTIIDEDDLEDDEEEEEF